MSCAHEEHDSLVPSVVDELLAYAAEDRVMDESGESLDDPDWILSPEPAGRYEIVRRVDPALEGLPKHLLRAIHCPALGGETYHCYMNWLVLRARTWAKYRQTAHPSIGDWIVYVELGVITGSPDVIHLSRVRNVLSGFHGSGPRYQTDRRRVETRDPYEPMCLGSGRTRDEAVSSALTNNPDRRVELIRWMGREGISR